jgi:SDR family mycofactocin-dependent oxidoreductase
MAPLSGKVAFITGAARGQGRAHSVKLASDGADVIAIDLCDQIASVPYPMATADDLAATVKLVEDTGARIVARQADVRDAASLSTALQAGLDEFGRLDIVVANAGIAPMQAGEAGWRDVIDVNLTGAHNTVEAAKPTMIEQGDGGSIVLISSAAGLSGIGSADAGSIGYAAAKHGMVGLMRVYANLLAPHSIRVNSVHPAGVDTPMINNEFIRDWLTQIAAEADAPQDMGNALPVQVLQPEDIANAVAWLVSDAARYVTGVTSSNADAPPRRNSVPGRDPPAFTAWNAISRTGRRPRQRSAGGPDRLRPDGLGRGRAARAAAPAARGRRPGLGVLADKAALARLGNTVAAVAALDDRCVGTVRARAVDQPGVPQTLHR